MKTITENSSHIEKNKNEKTCFLVYSTRENHVGKVIQRLTDLLSNELDFSTIKLDEVRQPGKQLLPDILKYTNECTMGIVILDGLRPNVILELGMILAFNTPCIILIEKDAKINVPSLLADIGAPSKKAPQVKIDIQKHLSDISNISWETYSLNDDISFRDMIRAGIKKLLPKNSSPSTHGHKGFTLKINSLLHRIDNSSKISSEKFSKLLFDARRRIKTLPPSDGAHICFHLVGALLKRNERNTALQEVVRGLKLEPKDDQLLILKSKIIFHSGQPEESLRILRESIKNIPQSKDLKREYLTTLNSNNNPKTVLKILSHLSYEKLVLDDLIPIKSHALFLNKQFSESLKLLIELYEYDSNKWAIHQALGLLEDLDPKLLSKDFIKQIEKNVAHAVLHNHISCLSCIVGGCKKIGLIDFLKKYFTKLAENKKNQPLI